MTWWAFFFFFFPLVLKALKYGVEKECGGRVVGWGGGYFF